MSHTKTPRPRKGRGATIALRGTTPIGAQSRSYVTHAHSIRARQRDTAVPGGSRPRLPSNNEALLPFGWRLRADASPNNHTCLAPFAGSLKCSSVGGARRCLTANDSGFSQCVNRISLRNIGAGFVAPIKRPPQTGLHKARNGHILSLMTLPCCQFPPRLAP